MKIKYFDYAIEWLFLALIFLTAVIFDRRIGIVFSLTKITTMRIFVIVILTIWAIKLILGGRRTYNKTPLDWPIFSYLLAVTAATITSVQVLISFMGFYGRFEGLTTWYVFGLFFFITAQYFRGLEKLKILIAVIAPTATVMAVYSMLQRHFLDPYAWGGVHTWQRVIATIGQPNFHAAYMCMAFFLMLYLFLMPGEEGRLGDIREGKALPAGRQEAEWSKREKRKREGQGQKVGKEKVKIEDWALKFLPLGYYLTPVIIFLITIYSLTGEQVLLWYLSFAAMAAFTLLFAYYYKNLPRIVLTLILGVSLVLSYISIFYTQSRGGYLGFAVGAVLFVIMVPRHFLFRNLKKVSALALVILLVTYWVAFVWGYSPFARFSSEISIQQEANPGVKAETKPEVKGEAKTQVELGGAAGSRGETWKSAYRIIADNPVFGIGPEVLKMVFPRYETELFRFKEAFHVKQDRCHNETFDSAVTKGLIGFFLYFGIIFLVFKIGFEKWFKADEERKLLIAVLLAAIASYIIQNQFSFGVVAITSLFWVMWALVCNVDSQPREEEKGEVSLNDIPWIPVALIVTAAFILIYFSTIQFRADRFFKTGKTLTEMGRFEAALLNFETSLRILPYEGGAITHFGITRLNSSQQLAEPERSKRLEEAQQTFEFGMRVDPYNADNFYIVSRIYLMKGNWVKAIEFAESALKIDPYYAEAHLTLANAYERLGQGQLAQIHYEKALKINPNLSEPKLKKAWGLFNAGNLNEAFNLFQELLISEPKNPEVHNGLGAIYFKRGERQRAKEEFEQTLMFSPGNEYAQRMLKWLK